MKKPHLSQFSKQLRKNQTPWESKLWYYLRGSRFKRCKFKRQVTIGNFIADFSCFDKKIIIELDGSQHFEESVKIKDLEKEKYFKLCGYKILRFSNLDIDNNLDGVLEEIRRTVE